MCFFKAFDKDCCKKECPCAFSDQAPKGETDFDMFVKMFKNDGDNEKFQTEEVKSDGLNEKIALEVQSAMDEVVKIIDKALEN